MSQQYMYRLVWFAVYKRTIVATWYANCKQPRKKWKAAVLNLYPKAKICCSDVFIDWSE